MKNGKSTMRSRFSVQLFQAIILLLVVPGSIVLVAQDKQDMNLFQDKSQQKTSLPTMPTLGPALEGPVDPERYIVGPSDVFAVDIWGAIPLNLTLTVSPEGTMIIPTVGEVPVAGRSLAEAKKLALSRIAKRYVGGQPTVTLIYPRQLLVKVTGDVVIPGRYVLYATNRVDDAIQLANRLPRTDEERLRPELEKVRLTASTRNIRLTHRDGTSIRVDIPVYYATHKSESNPYLLDGDEIFVPRLDGTRSVIGVYGGVNSPSRFEFAPGDSIKDAIQLAHGVTLRAMTDSVTLTSFADDGTTLRDTVINYAAILQGTAPDIALNPGDRIVVHERYDPRGDFRVTVEGEVLYPGTYPITRDQTHISEVIRRAGGFTQYAALRDVQVFRSVTKPEDAEREMVLSSRGLTFVEDSAYLYLESRLRIRSEALEADLEALYVQHDSSQDLTLRSQDTLMVPTLRNTVYVFGQVVKPGGVPFVPGRNVDYYIEEAKGFTDFAKSGDVVVIKRTTRQWFPPSDTKIEDGDYVWVPREVKHDVSYWLTIMGQSASILSVAITAALLVIQLGK